MGKLNLPLSVVLTASPNKNVSLYNNFELETISKLKIETMS